MIETPSDAPYGYDVWTHTEVVPKPPPFRWHVGPVRTKQTPTGPPGPFIYPTPERVDFTMQLTADQQVDLTLTGEDRYGNSVDIPEDAAQWQSSDESIVQLMVDETGATAVAVGPVGSSVVSVQNADGTVRGAIAIDVVAGEVTEVVITAGEPEDKPVVEHRR